MMSPSLPSLLRRTHRSILRLRRRHGPPSPRFSSTAHHPDPRLSFVCDEMEHLQSPPPTALPSPEPEDQTSGSRGGGERRVEVSHPWPEWLDLMDCLLKERYLDRTAFATPSASSGVSKGSNHVRTACLNFARDRFELIRYFSRSNIRIVVGSGCPSLDRKVVNSGKRLRAHVGIQEGDVCSSCNLRGDCERAYVKARKDEGGRTVDIMRILLTYGQDVINGSIENQACLTKTIKESVRKLLAEMVEFSLRDRDSSTSTVVSGSDSTMMEKSGGHQLPKGQIAVPTKQGDWICPKCNFLNFAKNIKCLRCNGLFQERLKKLHEDREHLPLKKGDWICEKCNFLNFAKNTKCLQCHEKPPNRHLNPGEWECVSCNYVNFRRNMVCLKCDWKRPKALNNGDFAPESQQGKQGYYQHPTITSTGNCGGTKVKHAVPQNRQSEDDANFWSSNEERGSDDEDSRAWRKSEVFNSFPMLGGRGATSQDPLARECWKAEMLARSQGVCENTSSDKKNSSLSFASFSSKEMDDYSSDDDIAGWFGKKSR